MATDKLIQAAEKAQAMFDGLAPMDSKTMAQALRDALAEAKQATPQQGDMHHWPQQGDHTWPPVSEPAERQMQLGDQMINPRDGDKPTITQNELRTLISGLEQSAKRLGLIVTTNANGGLFVEPAEQQGEQEPFGWAIPYRDDKNDLFVQHVLDKDRELGLARLKDYAMHDWQDEPIALYTHPIPSQQEERKPLNYEQIVGICPIELRGASADGVCKLVRAVEAAHNIKEQS